MLPSAAALLLLCAAAAAAPAGPEQLQVLTPTMDMVDRTTMVKLEPDAERSVEPAMIMVHPVHGPALVLLDTEQPTGPVMPSHRFGWQSLSATLAYILGALARLPIVFLTGNASATELPSKPQQVVLQPVSAGAQGQANVAFSSPQSVPVVYQSTFPVAATSPFTFTFPAVVPVPSRPTVAVSSQPTAPIQAPATVSVSAPATTPVAAPATVSVSAPATAAVPAPAAVAVSTPVTVAQPSGRAMTLTTDVLMEPQTLTEQETMKEDSLRAEGMGEMENTMVELGEMTKMVEEARPKRQILNTINPINPITRPLSTLGQFNPLVPISTIDPIRSVITPTNPGQTYLPGYGPGLSSGILFKRDTESATGNVDTEQIKIPVEYLLPRDLEQGPLEITRPLSKRQLTTPFSNPLQALNPLNLLRPNIIIQNRPPQYGPVYGTGFNPAYQGGSFGPYRRSVELTIPTEVTEEVKDLDELRQTTMTELEPTVPEQETLSVKRQIYIPVDRVQGYDALNIIRPNIPINRPVLPNVPGYSSGIQGGIPILNKRNVRPFFPTELAEESKEIAESERTAQVQTTIAEPVRTVPEPDTLVNINIPIPEI